MAMGERTKYDWQEMWKANFDVLDDLTSIPFGDKIIHGSIKSGCDCSTLPVETRYSINEYFQEVEQ